MLLHIPEVLDAAQLARARSLLAEAPWSDGRVTAGTQSAQVKHNEQLPEGHPATQQLQQIVIDALAASLLFFTAALPKKVFPPMFNRYADAANQFGNHIDNAVRLVQHGAMRGGRVRTDISCTLFLAEPDSYDGGELVIESPEPSVGSQRVKLPAGDLLLYPASTVHRVEPVTRGSRLASFFWIESMVRRDDQRRLLYELDMQILALREAHGDTETIVGLTGTYHNLLRMWAET
ncbi:MAG TPA: Fe2+-dependent dioxygenase [Methylibium sp.]|uniref:Fe2+-dependent dioxygenase n=1 Tax=Methylibium sp. TaxID=2067992 RepID=UPI002DB6F6C6|nr:Fe2+-dependent dioxygenase [Methylibium sp.]HEU4458495.1 Fe2+-dependent dioxygenase [Methylibium sp.]